MTAVLSCSFLSAISPTALVTLLAKYDINGENSKSSKNSKSLTTLSAIWLNNNGQNVIGFLPKTRFIVYPPPPNASTKVKYQSATQDNKSIKLQKIDRRYLPNEVTKEHLTKECLIKEYSDNSSSYVSNSKVSNYKVSNSKELVNHLLEYEKNQLKHNSIPNLEPDYFNQQDHYHNGFMGFISYDLMASELASLQGFDANYFMSKNNHHYAKQLKSKQLSATAYLGHYDIHLNCQVEETQAGTKQYNWQLHCTSEETIQYIESIKNWLKDTVQQQYDKINHELPKIKLVESWDKKQYKTAFQQTQEYLNAGDCYQINLTQQWQGKLTDDWHLVDYLNKLNQHTHAPFAGYVDMNINMDTRLTTATSKISDESTQGINVLSCSPELFCTFKKTEQDIQIITKPIKGTRPRGQTVTEDKLLKTELANSEKDLAENVMIVDLLRNDLGKYAQTGTVKVPKRFLIESFTNVHHMVSTITATIKPEVHPLTVLFGSLPAGSITGTPKKRAVEIINELEQQARGAYCGTMGYLNFDGSGQWNVLIRTLQADHQGNISLWAGGGITVASDCDDEYQECLDKVGNILQLLAGSDL